MKHQYADHSKVNRRQLKHGNYTMLSTLRSGATIRWDATAREPDRELFPLLITNTLVATIRYKAVQVSDGLTHLVSVRQFPLTKEGLKEALAWLD